MRRKLMFLLVCQLSFVMSFGQLLGLPQISVQEFASTKFQEANPSAHAIVLYEKGHSEIRVDEVRRLILVVHKYSARIKIIDKEGFDQANQTIYLFKIGNEVETLEAVQGVTYNLKDSSLYISELDKKAVFSEKLNDYVRSIKFTMPNIAENSIIDIQYEIHSPNIPKYRPWNFQNHLPKVTSEYTAIIPAMYEYNITLRGTLPLSDQKSILLRKQFLYAGLQYDASKFVYTMHEVPPFEEEAYMLAAKNYISAIRFELKRYYRKNGAHYDLTKSWNDVSTELLTDKKFGGQIDRKQNFANHAKSVYNAEDSKEEKARKIYGFFQKQVKWNRVNGFLSQIGVKESLEKHSGNIADINLGLISALRYAGIEAYPVLLSTRDNGLPHDIHPIMYDFNYVIALIKMEEDSYFLDASSDNLPFGLLPLKCINGQGRVIYSKKQSDWIHLENKEFATTTYKITGEMDDQGIVNGKLTITKSGLDALNTRNLIREMANVDRYIENRLNQSGSLKFVDGEVQNLENLAENLIESFTISMDLKPFIQNKELTITPILINKIRTNPFNLNERNYPVDLGSKIQHSYLLDIKLPKGYTLGNQPKNTVLSLPDEAAKYTFLSEYKEDRLGVMQELKLNRAIFEVDEYFDLKEFYSRIIQFQKIDFKLTQNTQ